MKVLIAEDETAAFENLALALRAAEPSAEIVGNTESVEQTVAWLRSRPAPDLIFMDVRLSDGSAFEIFDKVKTDVPVVFTTAYDRYALDAFRVNGIDYLLKPVKEEELRRALERFRRRVSADSAEYFARLARLRRKPVYKDAILIPYRDKLLPIRLDDVACFYTTDRNTFVCMRNGARLAWRETLDSATAMLDPARFFRANKQFVVARASVREITVWFDSRLRVALDAETPEPIYVSKNRAAEFKAWLVSGAE